MAIMETKVGDPIAAGPARSAALNWIKSDPVTDAKPGNALAELIYGTSDFVAGD
jgi:hypothetical protein